MSKAFTKEDDDGGVALSPGASFVIPAGPFHITSRGAALVQTSSDARLRGALARADVLPPVKNPQRAALGVTVIAQSRSGETRKYRLVTTEEQALTGDGCSVASPVGRALLGAEVGDLREIKAPKGNEELEVVALSGDDDPE